MGINNLLPLLSPHFPKNPISTYSSSTIGIDGHAWLHWAAIADAEKLFISRLKDEKTCGRVECKIKIGNYEKENKPYQDNFTGYYNQFHKKCDRCQKLFRISQKYAEKPMVYPILFYKRLMTLLKHQIKVIIVFDGLPLPQKLEEAKKRRERRESSYHTARELFLSDDKEYRKHTLSCISISGEIIQNTVKYLKDHCQAQEINNPANEKIINQQIQQNNMNNIEVSRMDNIHREKNHLHYVEGKGENSKEMVTQISHGYNLGNEKYRTPNENRRNSMSSFIANEKCTSINVTQKITHEPPPHTNEMAQMRYHADSKRHPNGGSPEKVNVTSNDEQMKDSLVMEIQVSNHKADQSKKEEQNTEYSEKLTEKDPLSPINSFHSSTHTRYKDKPIKRSDVRIIYSPYESDAQLSYLQSINEIDHVLTEDSDLIVQGCKSVLYKFKDGNVEEYNRAKILDLMDITDECSYTNREINHEHSQINSGNKDIPDIIYSKNPCNQGSAESNTCNREKSISHSSQEPGAVGSKDTSVEDSRSPKNTIHPSLIGSNIRYNRNSSRGSMLNRSQNLTPKNSRNSITFSPRTSQISSMNSSPNSQPPSKLKILMSDLLDIAILSGCDYLENIPKLGINRTLKYWEQFFHEKNSSTKGYNIYNHENTSNPNDTGSCTYQATLKISHFLSSLPKTFIIPPGYLQDFLLARNTFLYQIVWWKEFRFKDGSKVCQDKLQKYFGGFSKISPVKDNLIRNHTEKNKVEIKRGKNMIKYREDGSNSFQDVGNSENLLKKRKRIKIITTNTSNVDQKGQEQIKKIAGKKNTDLKQRSKMNSSQKEGEHIKNSRDNFLTTTVVSSPNISMTTSSETINITNHSEYQDQTNKERKRRGRTEMMDRMVRKRKK